MATQPYDVMKIRQDFPILNQEHHPGVPLVYLDNGATSQKPSLVIDALDYYYRTYNANVHRGIHKLSEEATAAYEDARIKIKRFINAKSKKEIIFTRGTTESINLVVHTWGRENLQPGDVVLSTVMEHHANIVPWQILAKEKGFKLLYIPIQDNGTLNLERYKELLETYHVKLVAVTQMSNVLGTINPIKQMAQEAHNHGALILVDGAQSVPHMPVDVQDLDADFLAFSSHKMCGPTGVGVLFGKQALLADMPPWMGGGDMIIRVTLENSEWNDLPYKFEAGTPSIAQAIGLGYAVDYLSSVGMDKIHDHDHLIIDYALERLAEIPGLTVYGPEGSAKGGIAAFSLDGISGHDIAQVLDSNGVAVRTGQHCAHPIHDILCVESTTRASFYLYNTFDEVDHLVNAIYEVKKLFKR